MPSAERHRRRLHPVLREYRRGVGRQPADDQGKVILFRLADAGVNGGVSVSQWQVQLRGSPKTSFSDNRWPLAKSVADMRLRPSSCTSINSSEPSPQAIRTG